MSVLTSEKTNVRTEVRIDETTNLEELFNEKVDEKKFENFYSEDNNYSKKTIASSEEFTNTVIYEKNTNEENNENENIYNGNKDQSNSEIIFEQSYDEIFVSLQLGQQGEQQREANINIGYMNYMHYNYIFEI